MRASVFVGSLFKIIDSGIDVADFYSAMNYRTNIRVKGGIAEKVKAGFKKYSPRLRKHTLHKIKRK